MSVKFHTVDFRNYGIYLIDPSNPSFATRIAQLLKGREQTLSDFPVQSIFLENRSSRSIVGYRITWEGIDRRGDPDATDVSNIILYVLFHGDESERQKAMAGEGRIIRPNSIWFIPVDGIAEPVEDTRVAGIDDSKYRSLLQKMSDQFSGVTISLDGLFFDDGTFLGVDKTGFFNEVKSQLDARYEILNGVEQSLKSGAKAEDVLKNLEKLASQPMPQLGERPTRGQYIHSFRVLFAKDVLGMKALYGTEKAIQDVHTQLAKPWVQLRKL
jgi:hypothetical protein